jgi:cell division protein FtsA
MKEIFALDVGTRKVMGIFAQLKDGVLDILDVEVMEHPSRAMFDGQIHSIEEVVKIVKIIKQNLESRLNKKLTKAGVAVAGRNLVTYKSKIERELDLDQEISQEMIRDMELEGVDKIISYFKEGLSQFYCVGYSPLYYELDGVRLSTLLEHRGKKMGVEVIATFLPRIVLESMFSVFKKAGLELVNITLEPIAAINAIIPQDMRQMNIVLVDIGAGTSDLALTREGVVFAYGMVPEAGDEITEAICEQLVVDFNTAERIKRSLKPFSYIDSVVDIEYEDIWGKKHTLKSHKLQERIAFRVKRLADAIAREAIQLNEGKPRAVVCVGGGSLTCNLIPEIAKSLEVEPDRVGIRLPNAIKGVKDRTKKLTGPDSVTPLGIAFMTAASSGVKFIEIQVNQKRLRMLDFQQKKDILGALMLAGIDNKKLYPRTGLALTLEVNSELKIVKGTLGEPAKINLNGKSVPSLSAKIKDGDTIDFKEAINGEDARAFVAQVISDIKPIELVFNQEKLNIMPPIIMNGEEVSLGTPLVDRARITTGELVLREALKKTGVGLQEISEREIFININGLPQIVTQRNFTLLLNGQLVRLDTKVKEGDSVEFYPDRPTFYRIKDVVNMPQIQDEIHINVDEREICISLTPVQIFMNGQRVCADEFLIDGADIKVYHLKEHRILLSDIFRYIDIDLKSLKGKTIKFLVNDLPAGFTTPLQEGSRVKILFEDRG